MRSMILSKPSYYHFKMENKKSYRLLLPGGIGVSLPDHETELHACPNTNLATE